jgi:hypothetical protein
VEVRGSTPGNARIFSSPQRPDWLWGPPSFLLHGYRGLPGIKRQGCEADHLHLSNAEVKNGGFIPPLPYMSSWNNDSQVIKHKDKFTFTVYAGVTWMDSLSITVLATL